MIEINNISPCIPQAKYLRGFIELIELEASDDILKVYSECTSLLFCARDVVSELAGRSDEVSQMDNIIDSFTKIQRNKNNSEKMKLDLLKEEYTNVSNIRRDVEKKIRRQVFKGLLFCSKIFPPLLLLYPLFLLWKHINQLEYNEEIKKQTAQLKHMVQVEHKEDIPTPISNPLPE